MPKHLLYLSGPMRGIKDFNFPAFHQAAHLLRARGHQVWSPAEKDEAKYGVAAFKSKTGDLADLKIEGFDLGEALLYDLETIADSATGVVVLPGWQDSRGSIAEVALAQALDLPVGHLYDVLEFGVESAAAIFRHGSATQGAVKAAVSPVAAPNGAGLGEDTGKASGASEGHPRPLWDVLAEADLLEDGVEVRVTSETGGQKGAKLAQLGALDPVGLLEVAKVAGYGAQKYDRYNMLRGYAWSLSFDALQRHLLAFWAGEDRDPESGRLHLGHAAWHCLTMISFLERDLGTDDRYVQP